MKMKLIRVNKNDTKTVKKKDFNYKGLIDKRRNEIIDYTQHVQEDLAHFIYPDLTKGKLSSNECYDVLNLCHNLKNCAKILTKYAKKFEDQVSEEIKKQNLG